MIMFGQRPFKIYLEKKSKDLGGSTVVKTLPSNAGFQCLPMWVPSLVQEQRSRVSCSQKKAKQNISNIVTNLIKTLKMVHFFKKS